MAEINVIPPSDSRESRLYEALRAKYPYSLRVQTVAGLIGLSWRDDPLRSFTLLCISFHRLNQELLGTGWQAVRTDVTPEAFYALSPVAES
ncbi:hypothetical protein HGP16_25370 [Rhizobium sp. P40RR-XXII]|uniref:hypothetical protein n=1 Tax=Rhizobium sp. P40RR-XXII TaxID=2726739 RepID=UPI0014565FF5|nr:hypothetical protein [Rhizobium sp. P40RR-XXII]NLS19873.1 hypothetical protein [Rhizobium sp. P40RR-XXII]